MAWNTGTHAGSRRSVIVVETARHAGSIGLAKTMGGTPDGSSGVLAWPSGVAFELTHPGGITRRR